MTLAQFKAISADSHVQQPTTFYLERVPAPYRDKTPRVVEQSDGTYLIADGMKPRRLDVAASRLTDEDREREFREEPSGGTDIERRIADQERDGVVAEVIYPNNLFLFASPDPAYQMAVAKAYSDWALEIFAARPDRFAPVAIIPAADILAAVSEVERVAKLGFRTVTLPIIMRDQPYNLPVYEPLWTAIDRAKLVLSFHSFSTSWDTYPDDWGRETGIGGGLAYMTMRMADGQDPVTLLIASGVLQRHPDLKFAVVECGAGWLAWLLCTLDEQMEKKHMWIRPSLEMLPSEFFKRQGYVTFGDDPIGVHNIPFTGSNCLMWGSDYPHDEGTFPFSQKVLERLFQNVPEEDARKVIAENAATLYGFSLQ